METASSASPPQTQVDHLVIAAASLDEGVQWCESTLGITPGPGGEHALMGTHNRVFTLASAAFAQAYFEIIAIHSGAACARPVGAKRWFDLDNPDLQQQLRKTGPRLVHFVARSANVQAGAHALAGLGIDRGEVLEASRALPQGRPKAEQLPRGAAQYAQRQAWGPVSAQGLLAWQITVRTDGQRLFNGALPTLIEWGEVHPTQGMAASGVTLQALQVHHPQPDALRAAYQAIGLAGVGVTQGPPNLIATLQTPRGALTLESGGI
ncbi:MAG: VOC family protein [Polaromonas sp.]